MIRFNSKFVQFDTILPLLYVVGNTERWLIWTLHLFHDRELRKWLRDFYAQNCTHHPKTCFEFEIISLHKFCVTTCVFFKSISAKRWRWCAFLQFIFRLHSSFFDNQCCQLNLKLIWGNLKNCTWCPGLNASVFLTHFYSRVHLSNLIGWTILLSKNTFISRGTPGSNSGRQGDNPALYHCPKQYC